VNPAPAALPLTKKIPGVPDTVFDDRRMMLFAVMLVSVTDFVPATNVAVPVLTGGGFDADLRW
jgi:hypothetical protein